MSRTAVATDTDRRGRPRHAVSEGGWIVATGYGVAKCTVIEMSDEGARVSTVVGLRIGDRVTLTSGEDVRRPAEVIWIEADVIGLQFVE